MRLRPQKAQRQVGWRRHRLRRGHEWGQLQRARALSFSDTANDPKTRPGDIRITTSPGRTHKNNDVCVPPTPEAEPSATVPIRARELQSFGKGRQKSVTRYG
jgi:hypothetical protein